MTDIEQHHATLQISQHMEAWDKALIAGSLVEVRWTNSHRYYAARAEVSQLNDKSIRVRLLEACTDNESGPASYPVGHRILVPRMYANRWSPNNGVFPLPPIQGIVLDESGARVARPLRSDQAICTLLDVSRVQAHPFCISSHVALLKCPDFVAIGDAGWCEKSLPIYEPAIPLRGPLFIVRQPLQRIASGYWQSLSSTDIASFQRTFGVVVRDVTP